MPLALLLAFTCGAGQAQSAAALLDEVQAAVMAARDSGRPASPDQDGWRDALRLVEQARQAEPDNPEVLLVQARLYSEVSWAVRAFNAWLAYHDATGEQPEPEAFERAAHQLGFSRYQAGDTAGALEYYRALLRFQPDDAEATAWIARIMLEAGDSVGALPYLRQLEQLDPADATVSYQLALARAMEEHGAEAARAFFRGTGAYETGDLQAALPEFQAALTVNPAYAEAAAWAGRTALELQDPGLASGYWRTALELQPDDERSRYFLALSEAQIHWGIGAANSFQQGQALYEAGELEAAHDAFRAAAAANAAYLPAWSWAARTAQELGRLEQAATLWDEVLARAPADEGARYFRRIVQQQLGFGAGATDEFLQAVALYQQGSFTEAETGFLQAIELTPDFAPAWGHLGQLYFAQGRYHEAATRYEQAAELDPTDEDFAFFAEEARRLATSP